MKSKEKRRSDCPIAFALDVFGDRWTLLVVRDLAFKGMRHFGEFLQAGEGVSTNILADRLSRLEAGGLVTSAQDTESGRRKIYRLTEAGLDLIPVLLQMIRWSAEHDADTAVSDAFRQQLTDDFSGVVADMRRKAGGG